MREPTKRDYLTRQLIAYIGNKRRLLPFLSDAFRALEERGTIRSFLDPFAGSGAVSRLAKTLGYSVAANDWEHYSWVVTAAHLTISPSRSRSLFPTLGGPEAAIAELNRVGNDAREHPSERGYLWSNYAPRSTEAADYRRERLFYTAENACFFDAVRDRIEEWYPGWDLSEPQLSEKLLLVSAVVYEAARRANTSGVFKACHKGFGGFGRDALNRILSFAQLEPPLLWPSTAEVSAENREATGFVAGHTADLCYLDPPYTIHQYGSNYHLLTTIARWDKPPIDSTLGGDGRLLRKAGIRQDWTQTHSEFCVRSKAAGALERLLDAADCRLIALSYNTEGIVPIEEVYETMSRLGRTELFGTDYVLYRGGKQSLFRKNHNLEYLLVLQKGMRRRSSDRVAMRRFLAVKRLSSLLRTSYAPSRVREEFRVREGELVVLAADDRGGELVRPMRFGHLFADALSEKELDGLSTELIEGIVTRLERARCIDRREEAEILTRILEEESGAMEPGELRLYQERLASVLKKFAHRKYRTLFEESVRRARGLAARDPQRYRRLVLLLDDLERVARLRFTG